MLGRLLFVWRLGLRDIKRRRAHSALLVVMIAATATTLALALALRHPSNQPFGSTRAVSGGPDVVAEIAPGAARVSPRRFAPLMHAPGVKATAGPFPLASAVLTSDRAAVPVQAVGRSARRSGLDRPYLLAGGWVRPGGVVVERGLAAKAAVSVGGTVRLAGRAFRVAGIAVSTAQPFYPARVPGTVWLTRGDATSLASVARPLGYVMDFKLSDPATAEAFVRASAAETFARAAIAENQPFLLETSQDIEIADYKLVRLDRKVMTVGSWLLLMLAGASIAVAVGGRVAEQRRRVGLLKAVGAGPALIVVALVSENVLLGLAGAGVGLAVGSLIAPSLASPGPGLLGQAPPPNLSVGASVLVVVIAVALAVAATVVPAVRGARLGTIAALRAPVDPPRRHPWLVRISAVLPAALLLGTRLMARRVRRTALAASGLMISVATVVAALTVKHDLQVTARPGLGVGLFTTSVDDSASHVLFVLSAVLVVLAAVTATFSAWATVIDAQRSTALARAFGATPGQITAGLAAAQLLPSLAAACLGIPAGLGLYELAGGKLSEARPPLLWLLAVVPGAVLTVAIVTALPARFGARRPVAEALRSD
ncbi:MAG: putative transport system permease protein [Solirubrobacteraceae bacterium]|jgi:putative ABC transport system permease protein|nr:putative transport system permease protein [Solirubrobacteraceae bacterium]